jgi:hypothetical protein
MKLKKSQISVEFVIVIAIALVIFLTLFAIIDRRNDELYSTRTALYARQEADKFASAINTIFLAGDGAQKTIILPETLRDNKDYEINLYPSSHLLEIKWASLEQTKHYDSPLITADITGSLESLSNITLAITNTNGGIVIG